MSNTHRVLGDMNVGGRFKIYINFSNFFEIESISRNSVKAIYYDGENQRVPELDRVFPTQIKCHEIMTFLKGDVATIDGIRLLSNEHNLKVVDFGDDSSGSSFVVLKDKNKTVASFVWIRTTNFGHGYYECVYSKISL